MTDLLLSADDTTTRNFQRACDQIHREQGAKAASDFAFKFGHNSYNWTGTDEALMEKTAQESGYRVDWHGADKEEDQ
jgi:hypothetical protein